MSLFAFAHPILSPVPQGEGVREQLGVVLRGWLGSTHHSGKELGALKKPRQLHVRSGCLLTPHNHASFTSAVLV